MSYFILRNNTWEPTSNKNVINNAQRTVKLYDFDDMGNEIFVGIGIYK